MNRMSCKIYYCYSIQIHTHFFTLQMFLFIYISWMPFLRKHTEDVKVCETSYFCYWTPWDVGSSGEERQLFLEKFQFFHLSIKTISTKFISSLQILNVVFVCLSLTEKVNVWKTHSHATVMVQNLHATHLW